MQLIGDTQTMCEERIASLGAMLRLTVAAILSSPLDSARLNSSKLPDSWSDSEERLRFLPFSPASPSVIELTNSHSQQEVT